MKPHVLISNSLDQLLDRLKQNIRSSGNNLFRKRDIILSDPYSRTCLEVALAGHCKTIFGLDILSIEEFVKRASEVTLLDMFLESDFDLQQAQERTKAAWYESKLELKEIPDELHFFAFSEISQNVNDLAFAISEKIPVFYYVLSPCIYFWSDICTDKEAKRLTHALKANQEYVYDRSRLLANHGTSMRNFMAYLEENLDDFQEEYVVKDTAAVRSEAVYKVLPGTHTLFDDILNDLLLRGSNHNKCLTEDASFQIHKVPTLAREVELLYQHIKDIPGKIVVYAPDIEIYRPYIESLFQSNAEIVATRKSTLLTLFLAILAMPYTKMQPKQLFELFQAPSFRKKCSLEHEDLAVLALALQKFDEDFVNSVIRMWISTSEISSTEAEVLGRAVSTFERLQNDIKTLAESNRLSLKQWVKQFLVIFERYFEPLPENRNEFYMIKRALILACKKDKENVDQKQALAVFKLALAELETKRECIGASPIIFASLGELRSVPRDTVCFLGMQEGVFLNAHDRHCILEAIFVTKSMLYISYQSYAFKERMTLQPASIVMDILEVRDRKVQEHPLESSGNNSSAAYEVPHSRLEDIDVSQDLRVLYVQELSQLAKYPLRAYLQRALGLYLHERRPQVRSSEFEVINPWVISGLKKRALLSSKDARELAILPPVLRTATQALVDEDVEALTENARALGLELDKPMQIELSLTAKQLVKFSPTSWKMPAIVLEKTTLAGTFSNLYPQGIVIFEKKSKEALYKIWPELLLLNLFSAQISIPPQVIFIKDAEIQQVIIENPQKRLKEYVNYVLTSHTRPSCLYPEWIELLKLHAEAPEKCFETSTFGWRDPYLDFYLSRIRKEDFIGEWKRWRQEAIALFANEA